MPTVYSTLFKSFLDSLKDRKNFNRICNVHIVLIYYLCLMMQYRVNW